MQPNRRRQPTPDLPGTAPAGAGTPRRRRLHAVEVPPLHAPLVRPYRRAYDGVGDAGIPDGGDRRAPEGPRVRRRSRGGVLHGFRRTPLRDGLVGLTLVGAAAPMAMSRLSALRTDPTHEQQASGQLLPLSHEAVGNAWRAATAEGGAAAAAATATTAREALIEQKLQMYGEMGLDRPLAETIYDLALKENIDPEVAFGLVRTESEFKSYATSHVGAIGLAQLMPATARWLRPGTTEADLRQPEVNLQIGFRYLRDLIEKYDGDQRLALLAYNRGPGTVDRVLKRGGDPDNGYAEAVFTGKGVH